MRISEVKNVMQSVIIQNYENIKKGASKDRLSLCIFKVVLVKARPQQLDL